MAVNLWEVNWEVNKTPTSFAPMYVPCDGKGEKGQLRIAGGWLGLARAAVRSRRSAHSDKTMVTVRTSNTKPSDKLIGIG